MLNENVAMLQSCVDLFALLLILSPVITVLVMLQMTKERKGNNYR